MKSFSLKNERGVVLITVYLVVTLLLVLGAAYLSRVIHEGKLSERERHAVEALYLAEGGLQQMLYDLRQDMSASTDWLDGDINGLAITPIVNAWTTAYSAVAMGEGVFTVELQAVFGNPSAMRIQSTGTSSGISRRILAGSEIIDLNLWNNVIFAGSGQSGNVINGNVDVRGSVHLLGDSLTPSDLAMDLSGSGNIGNNYSGMPAQLSSRVPALTPINFNGEMVESLGAEVRVKRGKLGLSGTGVSGSQDVTGNSLKETVNGMYITDGYGGNQGINNVFSDNGTANGYDGGGSMTFKRFTDPFKDGIVTYPNYPSFVTTKGLLISQNNIKPGTPDFTYSPDANGNSISWTNTSPNSGTLAVQGVVYLNNSLDLGEKNDTVYYTGKGTIVTLGGSSDIEVHGDLLSNGTFATDHVLAFVAEDGVEIGTGGGESQLNITGVFYGQGQITMDKQCQLAGTFNSNYFEMEQTPSIYRVPSFDAKNHPGLIGRDPIYVMKLSSWQEIQ